MPESLPAAGLRACAQSADRVVEATPPFSLPLEPRSGGFFVSDMSAPHLPISADALLAIAEAFGTPTYVYDEATVRARCAALRHAMRGLPVRLLYALKANPQPALLRAIHDEGFGFDSVSPGEVALLRRLGVAPSDILYTTTSTSDDELAAAGQDGVLVNLDDVERLDAFGRLHPGAEVSVRFNPGVGAGHHRHVVTGGKESKFGVPLERAGDAVAAAARHGLRVVGLHQHMGSGVDDPAELLPAAEALLSLVPLFPDLRFLDLGGGFGVPYRPGDRPLDLVRLRTVVVEPALARLRETRGASAPPVELWFEPGRYPVAEAGVLLARVHTLKAVGEGGAGRVFAGTDSGFNHLVRPALYGAYHALANLSNPEGPLRRYDVVGNICESGDLFAREREVQELRRGDVLAVLGAGAYGMAMASTYNLRPLPAEVLVTVAGEARLIRRRLTPDALADALLAETAGWQGVAA